MENKNNITRDPKRIAAMRHEVLKAISAYETLNKQKIKKVKIKKIKVKKKLTKSPIVAKESISKKNDIMESKNVEKKDVKKIKEKKIKLSKKTEDNIKNKKESTLYVVSDGHQKSKKQIKILTILIVLFLIISLFLLMMVSWVPKSESKLAKQLSSIIPFPAIIIGKKVISYDQYLKEVEAVEKFLKNQKNKDIQRKIPSHDKIKEDVKDYFIKHEMVLILAKQNNITLTKQDIQGEIDKIYSQIRSKEELNRVLNEIYGWSRKDYEEKVIIPYLLGVKLSQKFFPNLEDRKEIEKRWNDVVVEAEKSIKIYIFLD